MRRRHSKRETEALDAALSWARAHGLSDETLPRGRRDSVDECPIARGTGLLVAKAGYADPLADGNLTWCRLPNLVELFVDLFDRGRYPELELR